MLNRFDMVLGFAQWQGSGRNENLPRGAAATTAICAEYGPVSLVSISGDCSVGNGVNRWAAIFGQFRSAQDLLRQQTPNRVLTAGGDCSVDVAVIDYLHGLYPDLTVIWVDAHLDANSVETSPSGDFHGMPVRVILGDAPEHMQLHLQHPLLPEKFRYFSARVGDDGDWAFQRSVGLEWLKPEQNISGPIHVHFDLDVLDPEEFPYLAYREANGLSVSNALALLTRIANEGDIVGLTITEFAPANDAEALAGGETIAKLCASVCVK